MALEIPFDEEWGQNIGDSQNKCQNGNRAGNVRLQSFIGSGCHGWDAQCNTCQGCRGKGDITWTFQDVALNQVGRNNGDDEVENTHQDALWQHFNSVYQIETIRGYLEDMGYTCEAYAFTDVNDLSSVTQTACDNSDVIYIPTDNTAAGNAETIANVVLAAGVPVVAGESGICSGCGVATLSIDYYELGYTTGEMAAKILTGEADVSTMAVEYAPTVTKMYNAANCEALGLTMPEDYVAIEG